MHTKDDSVLVALARTGRTEAFAALVQRHQSYAHGAAAAMIADFELARDVVQEAFLAAYLDLDKLNEPDRFRAWLCGIVRNMALKALREREKVFKLAAELGAEQEGLTAPDEEVDRRWVLRRAMEGLRAGDRELLCLFYMNGLAYAEIAGHLDVNTTTVKGRLQRARVRLRERVDMVEKELAQEGMPDGFAAEVRGLLDGLGHTEEQRAEAIGRLAGIGTDAVAPLAEALEDDRAWVRHVAVRALCALGDGRALKPLLRLLYGRRELPHMHEGELLAVPGMREALLELVRSRAWNRDDRDDRKNWAWIFALGKAEGDREVFDCLAEVFGDAEEHWSIRYFALSALMGVDADAAAPLVVEGVGAVEAPLVDRALRIAARYGVELSLDAYEGVLRRPDWSLFPRLLDKVVGLGDEGVQWVEEKAGSDDPTERLLALQALAGSGAEGAAERLREGLLDGGSPRDADAAWHDPFWVRDFLWAHKDAAGPLVAGYLHAGLPGSRVVAVQRLARERGVELAPELRRILAGSPRSRGKVARRAFWALHDLGEKAEPTVLEMLASDNWRERKAAVCLLKRWGKLTAEQGQRAADDAHVAVRRVVERA